MSKMKDNLNYQNNYNLLMHKIQCEIKDIVINKFLSLIMIQDKEINILKNQCEDFLNLSTKILKKNIITESSHLNSPNTYKNDFIHFSKKSTLNSSNENINNNNTKFSRQIISTNDSNIKFVKNKNNVKSKEKKTEKTNLKKDKINDNKKKGRKSVNFSNPLQRSESSSLLLENHNNFFTSNLNEYMIPSYLGSGRKDTYKKTFISNIENLKGKFNNDNSNINKNSGKLFSRNNNNTPLKTEINENSKNKFNLNNNSMKNLLDTPLKSLDNKKIKNETKRYFNKSLTSSSLISHLNNISKGKEKLKVNTSKSILSSSKNNIINVNNDNNYNRQENLLYSITERNENKNGKIGNSYLFKFDN